jgi:hypothetical protein
MLIDDYFAVLHKIAYVCPIAYPDITTTTLVRDIFADKPYVSLEDPRGFLKVLKPGLVCELCGDRKCASGY